MYSIEADLGVGRVDKLGWFSVKCDTLTINGNDLINYVILMHGECIYTITMKYIYSASYNGQVDNTVEYIPGLSCVNNQNSQ